MDFVDLLKAIVEWLDFGIFDFVQKAYQALVIELMIMWIKIKISSLEFAWAVAQGVLTGLNVSGHISSAFGFLPAEISSAAAFFRVPEAVNIILSSAVARFVLNMIPGV
jgi:hypothetical protein